MPNDYETSYDDDDDGDNNDDNDDGDGGDDDDKHYDKRRRWMRGDRQRCLRLASRSTMATTPLLTSLGLISTS